MSTKAERRLEALNAKKESLYTILQTLLDLSKGISDPIKLNRFKILYRSMQATRVELMKIIDEIVDVSFDVRKDFVPDFSLIRTIDEICCYVDAAADRIAETEGKSTWTSLPAQDTNIRKTSLPKLPKIELPEFSGNIREWETFYSIFKNLIHENVALTNVDKVYYLIGRLRGAALSLCSGVPPTGENYEIIWQTLVDKYQDTRSLANSYFEQIIDFKPLTFESSKNLDLFLEKFDTAVQALQKLELTDLADFMLVYLALNRLDSETVRLFELSRHNVSVPSYSEVIQFVKAQSKLLCSNRKIMSTKSTANGSKQRPSKSFLVRENNSSTNSTNVKQNICIYCNQAWHHLEKCEKFKQLSPSMRYETVKRNGWCYNCLFSNHMVRTCNSKRSCIQCGKRHHFLLHYGRPSSINDSKLSHEPINQEIKTSPPTPSNNINCDDVCSTVVNNIHGNKTVLLSTVVVNVTNSVGNQMARFLLDSGSQAHLLTVNCCKRLGLKISKFQSSIQGLGKRSYPVKGVASLNLASRHNPSISYLISTLLVDKISEKLPKFSIDVNKIPHIRDYPLADDAFYEPGEIDGIIGAELFPILLGSGRVTGPLGAPIGFETVFGYIVMGSVPSDLLASNVQTFLTVSDNSCLIKDFSRFWELEEVPKRYNQTLDDVECEKQFARFCSRDISGRFTVALPFKDSVNKLGDSKAMAQSRLYSLEHRLSKNFELRVEYNKIMQNFIDQGHMQRILQCNLKDSSYYIPHHAVFKPESTSTPIRIVLDASAASDSGFSLNDLLYSGPKLQTDIFTLLINFRLFKFAVTADIRQMYRQINIIKDHRRFQRVLWRFSPEEEIDTYELKTVAFGIKSSPYLALRTVEQLIKEEGHKYPFAAEIIPRDIYMDDLVSSLPSLDDAERLFTEAVDLFSLGQFELTKWSTNSNELLEKIPEQKRLSKPVTFKSDTKILGLEWDPEADMLGLRFPIPDTICTKRTILSTIAKCYDPLGLIAPFIMFLKCLVKELWLLKIDWDDMPEERILRVWAGIRQEWSDLNNIRVSRHIVEDNSEPVMLIGFGDASNMGYGAVIYLRGRGEDGNISVKLVCAKSKVSPVKFITIPRLELCAALLLSKLIRHVKDIYKDRVLISDIWAFTDSLTVMHWLQAINLKDVFVSNRVVQILDNVPEAKWRHVEGVENSADILSRGATLSQLSNHPTWSHGPPWLKEDMMSWPVTSVMLKAETIGDKETVLIAENISENHPLYELILRHSSWLFILRTTVWILRFLKVLPLRDSIFAFDLWKAEVTLIKLVQLKHFHSDIRKIIAGNECSSRLRKLRPFIQDGLIRVGGRLSHANIALEQKHPILLPGKDPFVTRLIDYYHQRNLHTGPYLLDALLRQKYWILSARNIIRHRVHACNRCFRVQPKPISPLMADLPAFRAQQSKAFTHTGVDYFGPVGITLGRKRGAQIHKAYACLFVCMSIKAIHLELVSSLSTEHFLQAFKRFLSRRGPCAVLYSDRGTNFVGAKVILNKLYKFLNSTEYNDTIQNNLASEGIQWKLNPASAPHMGGIWESNVKSVKKHIYRVIGDQLLTYEELSTLLTQIECLLNSRPLCRLSDDPTAPSALTPAHFLTLSPLKNMPAEDVTATSIGRLNRFQLIDRMVQDFWKRWHLEYLTTLQIREKWNKVSINLEIGTVVIIKNDNTPPLRWPLAVVLKVHPGQDGIVRIATVKTQTGVFTRPIVKLCPLPTQ